MRTEDVSVPIQYIRSAMVRETETMKACRQWLITAGVDGMQVGPEEGSYLAFFANLIAARKIVEIGTLGGYSGLWLASALPKDGWMVTMERRESFAAQARVFFDQSGYGEQIQVLVGDAKDSILTLENRGPVDLVFVDADKKSYFKYLKWCEEHLRPGGLLIADNTFLFGTVWSQIAPKRISRNAWEAVRKFNQTLADSPHWRSIVLPTHDGLLISQKI
jgi:predicted O-methyltransferase YrrM